MFAKVFLNLNLYSITTAQVSLMCQRLVDFYEPIYHRLLSRFHTFETLFSFLFKVFKNSSNLSSVFKGFFGMFFKVFSILWRCCFQDEFLVLILLINNHCSNIVILVYRFTNKLLIIYFYTIRRFDIYNYNSNLVLHFFNQEI